MKIIIHAYVYNSEWNGYNIITYFDDHYFRGSIKNKTECICNSQKYIEIHVKRNCSVAFVQLKANFSPEGFIYLKNDMYVM